MKYLKYIALMLFAVLSAACESLPLPIADITVQKQGVVALGSNSATLEIVFAPTAATIQSVVASYSTYVSMSNAAEWVMKDEGNMTYRVELANLRSNTTYYVRYTVSNAVSVCTIPAVQFTTKDGTNIPSDTNNNYEYVDLGLSVKWATCNVGATRPEGYGDYFAWGETQTKSTYDWSTYKWCKGSYDTQTKYCTKSIYGSVDNKKTLELSDDAARANWGGNWRMPTTAEQDELRTQCIWAWTTQNGVKGYKVISKINGNSIFLPAAGYRSGSSLYNKDSEGFYWSSTLYSGNSNYAYYVSFTSNDVSWYSNDRCYGQSVRPVYGAREEDTNNETYFSVSATKKVTFSKGNLQYHPANNKWRFAENQTDYIGDANSNISSSYNGWLDLFGWSTSATNFGVSTSTSNSDYSGSFVDWGTNQIGADAPHTWRTLTYGEWIYLLDTRTNASSLKGVAQVNGVNGLILLPDHWKCPADITFKSGFYNDWSGKAYGYGLHQTLTAEQWSKLESAGAVFLPAAGHRLGLNVRYVQESGYYWSATEDGGDAAYCIYFGSARVNWSFEFRYCISSVRLVKDL